MAHWEGSPDCAEVCAGPHLDDALPEASECCEQCGGNGRACRFGCIEARRSRSEPWEGSTGLEESFPY